MTTMRTTHTQPAPQPIILDDSTDDCPAQFREIRSQADIDRLVEAAHLGLTALYAISDEDADEDAAEEAFDRAVDALQVALFCDGHS